MRLVVRLPARGMRHRPGKFRIVSVTWTALIVGIKTESAVVDVDVDAKVEYASAHKAILILLVLIDGFLLLLRKCGGRGPHGPCCCCWVAALLW
jgi:hypothetical protein